MYPVPPCPSASTLSPTAPALLPSSSEKPGARGNESGDRPSPTFRKSPNPSSTPSALSSKAALETLDDAAAIRRSLPHGHVAALLGLATQLGLPRILNRKPCRQRDLALAAVIARLIHPASKLATARALSPETADSSLGALLGLGGVSGNELLDMLDWLSNRQPWIEQSLSRRHLHNTTLILYDVTSTYLGNARWPPSVTTATERRGKSRWSSACSAPLTAVRSRSKSSPATPPTRPRWPPRSARSGTASGSAGWPWWATAA